MKRFHFFANILLALTCMVANAQNWGPINPGYKYNYYPDTLGYENIVTIHVDSLNPLGNDTIYYLNRIIVPSSGNLLIRNSPQFLQRTMTKKSNGDFLFRDTAQYLIRPFANIGDSWTFDSANAITAQLVSDGYNTTFGTPDSIRYIVLSCGDTIVLSKNHGLLSFSVSYANNVRYVLAGLEELNAGVHIPRFYDFFSFNVGDLFQYNKKLDYVTHPFTYNFSTDSYYKVTILSKHTSQDTISFGVSVIGHYSYLGYTGTHYTNYYNYISTITYLRPNSLDLDNGEELANQNPYYETYLYQDTIFLADGKGFKGIYISYGNDILQPPMDVQQENIQYASGRGFVSYHHHDQLGFDVTNFDSVLTGCVVNGITYGTIQPDSFFNATPILPDKYVNVILYPNPFENRINITSQIQSPLEIIFYDLDSKIVLRQTFIKTVSINTSQFIQGTYLYEVRNKNEVIKKGQVEKN